MIGWAVAIIGGVLMLYVVWTFNRLVSLHNRAEASWSDIDVQLKRRWDLVPSLVAAVEGYTQHEAQTLRGVVVARQQAVQAGSVGARGLSEFTLTEAVHGVFALVEGYPELKANRNFLDLQSSLIDIENNVQYARRYYNAVVRDLNTLIVSFPSNLVASLFRFREREFFQLDDVAERTAPGVEL